MTERMNGYRDPIADGRAGRVLFLKELALGRAEAIRQVRGETRLRGPRGVSRFLEYMDWEEVSEYLSTLEKTRCMHFFGIGAGRVARASRELRKRLARSIAKAFFEVDMGSAELDGADDVTVREELDVYLENADADVFYRETGKLWLAQLEEEAREEEQRRLRRFNALVGEVQAYLDGTAVPRARRTAIRASSQDLVLALQWTDQYVELRDRLRVGSITLEKVAELHGQDHELERLLSARMAEHAVMRFYRSSGREVVDVSGSQLAPGNDGGWLTHDVLAGAVPIDVKNARRSRSHEGSRSPEHYVEHCVPAFKNDRNQVDVVIVGVLSPYVWMRDLIEPMNASPNWDTDITILGECSRGKLEELRTIFERSGDFDLGIVIHGRNSLPPWVYDYPRDALARTPRPPDLIPIFEEIRAMGLLEEAGISPVALGLTADIDPGDLEEIGTLDPWQRDLATALWLDRREGRFSLPFVFLRLLTHFLQMLRSPHQQFRPERYRDLVFLCRGNVRPLALPDPLKTIDSLISCLTKLWRGEHELLRRYSRFKLAGMRILRGMTRAGGRWETLLTHCGGRGPTGPCAFYPLLLSERASQCPDCGYLICPVCGFCMEGCQRHGRVGSPVANSPE